MLKFEPRGPELEIEGTKFLFKRASQHDLNKWNLENNPFKNRSKEEKFQIQKLINNKKVEKIEYTDEEINESIAQMPKFALDFCENVLGLENGEGEALEFNELSEDMKLILFEELYNENENFSDFLISYKSGTKKKFTEVVRD